MPYSNYETIPQLIAAMMRRSALLWPPVPRSRDSKPLEPLMLECLSWEPSKRPTMTQLHYRLFHLHGHEGFDGTRDLSKTHKELEVDFYKSKKIRSRAKIDIDTHLAIRALEHMLTHD